MAINPEHTLTVIFLGPARTTILVRGWRSKAKTKTRAETEAEAEAEAGASCIHHVLAVSQELSSLPLENAKGTVNGKHEELFSLSHHWQ